jgi:Cys/Met metabolism PLP-dependent enzyme
MPILSNCRWQPDSRKPASGKPGAVQHALELLLLALLYLSLLATETVKHEMVAAGAGLDVVRLLIGLETGDDIIADLDQALKAAA